MWRFCIIFLHFGYTFESNISAFMTDPIKKKTVEICLDIKTSSLEDEKARLVLIDMRDIQDIESHFGDLPHIIEGKLSELNSIHPHVYLNNDSIAPVVPSSSWSIYGNISGVHFDNIIVIIRDDASNDLVDPDSRVITCTNFILTNNILQAFNRQNATGLIIMKKNPRNFTWGEVIVSWIFLNSMCLWSICLSAFLLMRNNENLSTGSIPSKSTSLKLKIIISTCFIALIAISTVLALLAPDVFVLVFVVIFVIGGAFSFARVSFLILTDPFPRLKDWTITLYKKNINLFGIVLYLVGLVMTIVWAIYRNNIDVGWKMQNIIFMFVIVQTIFDSSHRSTFKSNLFVFVSFMICEIMIVLVSPSISKDSSNSTISLSSPENQSLIQAQHSTRSVMEALFIRYPGRFGEMIPLMFKLYPSYIFPDTYNACYGYFSLIIGFFNIYSTGIFCGFLAYYEARWNHKLRYLLIVSILGYLIGTIISMVVVFCTAVAQPALAYQCPCVIIATLLFVRLRGGKKEIINLWQSNLPTPPGALLPNMEFNDDESVHSTIGRIVN